MENKKIKVKILASSHPQFDEIIDFPPKGVEYGINRVKTKYHSWITENKIALHGLINWVFPLPRMTHTKTDADIVHSTRGIIQLFQKKPWIIDCENGDVFTSFNRKSMKNPITRKIIMHALKSKNCKRILPQSNAAKDDLRNALGKKNWKKIEDKVEVLYLAMRPYKGKKIMRKNKKIVLSYVGWDFYGKGGQDLLKAYEILSKKYKNLELKFKGDVPEESLRKAKSLPGFKHITAFLSREKLFEEMYLSSDIFVFPTTKDHYGVVLLEAMSAGLPLVGTRSFTVPELIIDGKNGFLVDTKYSWENYWPKGRSHNIEYMRDIKRVHPEIVEELVEKLSMLVENKKLREKMGMESRKMIEDKDGKLSITKRNEQLLKIYQDALKK